MFKPLSIFFFLISLGVFGQTPEVAVLDSALHNQWIGLAKDWRYQKGDDMEWANPAFNDDSWPVLDNFNLNQSGSGPVAGKHEIAWFRKRLKADSTLNEALILNIYQKGASEIYLDGKLIHKLGVVSTNPNKLVYFNPRLALLSFPLQKKEQVLSIRFLNDYEQFPLYQNDKGYLRILVTSVRNTNSKDIEKNGPILSVKYLLNRYYITFGVSIFLCLLFSSFFFFFPSEKVNGYFALSSFFLALFIEFVIRSINTNGKSFWIDFGWSIFSNIQILLLLYCVYKIFNRSLGLLYWIIIGAGFFSIPLLFLFRPNIISPAIGVLTIIEIIRINIVSQKTNKIGTLIFLIFGSINLLYWVGYLTNLIPDANQYLPFAFMLTPISLAIYLGYAFGARSEALRSKLQEVEELSKEKQLILASQNETLEQQVKERTSALNQSLENLKSTQAQLIQSEKMASLGDLTAGIAHEIQNPLNFVNNFSEVSGELIEEVKIERAKVKSERDEVFEGELLDDIAENLKKINHHGKRADTIVKGMLQHSRKSSGQEEATDINVLCNEYLRLAYYGFKAKNNAFDVKYETSFDKSIGMLSLIRLDMGRVILNLLNNAFYAAQLLIARAADGSTAGNTHMPTVWVSTRKVGDNIEIEVKDNGPGIPDAIKEKIFQPFFTTKPTGQGTGLGLSLAYDILKAHGGTITVESEVNKFTRFVISLKAE